jgi:hypothetical protein
MATEIAQGTPGSGKSAVAVARMLAHLWRGGVAACNFSLVDGWAETYVKNKIIYILLRMFRFVLPGAAEKYLFVKSTSLYKRLYRVDSLPAIRKIFPLQESVWSFLDTGKYSEGSGLLVLDECQLVFNTRNCMVGSKNLDWIEFFTQHRKLGWNCVLIAHSMEMIDSQIRPLAEYTSTFRNLQKVRIPIIGLPLWPYPYFLVVKRYAGMGAGSNMKHSHAGFPLPLWAAELYDSLLVFSAEGWGKDTEPRHCGNAPVESCMFREVKSRLVGCYWDAYLKTEVPS